jgi:uncharacterized membrane protein YdfJ with MMPL/SSD domain
MRLLENFEEQHHSDGFEDCTDSESDAEADIVTGSVVAKAVFKMRGCFIAFWVISAACLAPFAYFLILDAAPMTKEAPQGTESREAMNLFQQHFPDLSHMRREMVVISCRTRCKSAANDVSGGIVEQISSLILSFGSRYPRADVHINSYFTFAGHHQLGHNPMISSDQQSVLLLWVWSVSDSLVDESEELIGMVSNLIEEINAFQGPDGLMVRLTGLVTLDLAMKETVIEEVPVHELATIWLPFLILALALRSARMLLLALVALPIEILTAFGIMYFVSLKTPVLFYCLMTMLMLCTSLSFDYSLFMLTRYAEERAAGESVEQSLLTTISQGGRVVMISGVVLATAWGSVVWLPPPFNTFGSGTTTMILVTVLAQLTLVPSILAVLPFLGPPAAEKLSRSRGRGSPVKGSSRTETKRLVGTRGRPSTRDTPTAKAETHRQGIVFRVGKCLISFPVNLIVLALVYGLMMPLTLRMGKNFSLLEFKFKMGHSYELGIPRHREEWSTALQIQKDFPTSVGIMMPMLIIGTGGPPSAAADANSASVAAAGGLIDVQGVPLESRALPATDIDVEGDEFFEANCRMVDSLIQATRNMSYALTVDSFVSATFHEGNTEGGGVECLSPSLIKAIRTNYVSKKMLLTHTSENLQRLWDQLVSKDGNAMLTFAFPDLDPFGPGAFSLVTRVREALRNETQAAQRGSATLPGLTFTVFSPSSVIMDLIDVTSNKLPVTFAGCIAVNLLLIAVSFGAVLVPMKLFMTVVIPITWTYGAALYVYEDGVLAWLDMPCLAPLGDAGLDWSVPVMTLTFIVGLAFDYEIFLIERVREFREQGFSDQEAILLGLAATSETITAAGLIMTFTFIAELLSTIPVSNQMGFILVFSIVVDTFVVRSVLLPTVMSICCTYNFWPSRMPEPCMGESRYAVAGYLSDDGGVNKWG